jgi:hypothetical protein
VKFLQRQQVLQEGVGSIFDPSQGVRGQVQGLEGDESLEGVTLKLLDPVGGQIQGEKLQESIEGKGSDGVNGVAGEVEREQSREGTKSRGRLEGRDGVSTQVQVLEGGQLVKGGSD